MEVQSWGASKDLEEGLEAGALEEMGVVQRWGTPDPQALGTRTWGSLQVVIKLLFLPEEDSGDRVYRLEYSLGCRGGGGCRLSDIIQSQTSLSEGRGWRLGGTAVRLRLGESWMQSLLRPEWVLAVRWMGRKGHFKTKGHRDPD